MSRPSRAVIDLDAFRANYLHARSVHGGRVAAVLKANAYGHGALRCASAIQDIADAFAVAFTEEAMHLRESGIRSPILVLEGAFNVSDVELARKHNLWLVIHQLEQVKMLEQLGQPHKPINVWLKIDTGMHRAGLMPANVAAAWNRLKACASVASIHLMTHLCSADEPNRATTRRQLGQFQSCIASLPGERSVANSAGILEWPGARQDWGRAGLMLYGVHPVKGNSDHLRPVMSLQSQIFSERRITAGERVGYGEIFVANRPTRVGLVAIGYADGYPRNAPNGTPVAVNGHIVKTIGRVSMDMLTVDLTDHPELGLGSEVELWGSQVPVHRVAQSAGTIAYELLCNVKRVPLGYTSVAIDLERSARI